MSTKISWCDKTWNPIRGCSRVSAGCERCYAERWAHRNLGGHYDGLTRMSSRGPAWTGDIRLVPEKLDEPLHWRKPRRVFVASMSDPFHDAVPTEYLDRVFAAMALAPQHSYQLLTKRPARMREYVSNPETPRRVQKAMDCAAVDAATEAEEWRTIPGCAPYEVSSLGRVRRAGRMLKLVPHGNGYRQVAICLNAEPRNQLVHRLVLTAFDRTPRDGEETCHLNGDRADNRRSNLRWGSKAENMSDAARHGTAGSWMKSRALLTAEQVAEIRERRAKGEKLSEIASRFGIDKRKVSAIALGRIYKPVALEWPLRCLWLGVSVENQPTADERIAELLQTPAAVRWVSYEPALEAVDWHGSIQRRCMVPHPFQFSCRDESHDRRGIDWLVVGGESGPGARPCHVEWIRSARDQCKAAGVPLFVKQFGAKPRGWCTTKLIPGALFDPGSSDFCDVYESGEGGHCGDRCHLLKHRAGADPAEWPEDLRIREFPA